MIFKRLHQTIFGANLVLLAGITCWQLGSVKGLAVVACSILGWWLVGRSPKKIIPLVLVCFFSVLGITCLVAGFQPQPIWLTLLLVTLYGNGAADVLLMTQPDSPEPEEQLS